MADYFSFEDVMSELELSEEDLKRMVSEGELRAFRDENKMKFKKEDVEGLKKGRITEPTIILPSTPGGGTTDETVLDLDIGEETNALADTALGGEGDSGETSELVLDETDLTLSDEPDIGIEADETFIEEEVDTGLTTEPLKLADEADETVEAEAVDEEIEAPAATATRRPSRVGRRVTAQIPVGVEEEIEAKRAHWIWTVLLLLALMSSTFSGVFFYDLARQETGVADKPLNITAWAANFVLEKFWEDKEWTKFHIQEFPAKGSPPYETLTGYQAADWYSGPSFERSDYLIRESGE